MKSLFSTVALAFVAVAAFAQQTAEYNIKGTCAADVKKVYIVNPLARGNQALCDSATVTAGKFALKGTAQKDALLRIFTKQTPYAMPFFNDGTPIQADMVKKTISASEQNNKLVAYDNELDAMNNELRPFFDEYNKARQSGATQEQLQKLTKEIEAKMAPVQERIANRTLEIVKANQNNLIPAAFLGNLVYELEYPQIKDLFDAKYAYVNHPALARANQIVKMLAKKAAFIGQKFTDLEENDVNGQPHKLSEYLGKGNYVLLDFWASWCGPCRAEMPNVKAAYEKYKGKGFNIVALSFDNKLDSWKKAIEDMQMPWIHLSDLKGWQTVAGQVYGVRSIPASFLVDPNGTIVAADLRGEKLGAKLKEIYGEEGLNVKC